MRQLYHVPLFVIKRCLTISRKSALISVASDAPKGSASASLLVRIGGFFCCLKACAILGDNNTEGVYFNSYYCIGVYPWGWGGISRVYNRRGERVGWYEQKNQKNYDTTSYLPIFIIS